MDELEADEGVDSGSDVVEHDAPAFGKEFDLADWRRLGDVEEAEEDEPDDRVFPTGRGGNEGDPLADDLVGDDDLGVFAAALAGDDGRGGDGDGEQDQCGCGGEEGEFVASGETGCGRRGDGEVADDEPDCGCG